MKMFTKKLLTYTAGAVIGAFTAFSAQAAYFEPSQADWLGSSFSSTAALTGPAQILPQGSYQVNVTYIFDGSLTPASGFGSHLINYGLSHDLSGASGVMVTVRNDNESTWDFSLEVIDEFAASNSSGPVSIAKDASYTFMVDFTGLIANNIQFVKLTAGDLLPNTQNPNGVYDYTMEYSIHTPEPAPLALLGLGLIGVVAGRHLSRKK